MNTQWPQACPPFVFVEEKKVKPQQMIVKLFMGQKLRWVANGLCPVWLVPETHEENNG